MMRAGRTRGIGLLLLSLGGAGCQRGEQTLAADDEAASAPDRLEPGEQLPESETAFGLPLPAGMRLERQFKDAAYFSGEIELQALIERVAEHVDPRSVELVNGGALFERVHVKGDDSGRQLRITLKPTPLGSQVHVEDTTSQAPPVTGLSQEELWRRAGRNPDGTPLDQNQLY